MVHVFTAGKVIRDAAAETVRASDKDKVTRVEKRLRE